MDKITSSTVSTSTVSTSYFTSRFSNFRKLSVFNQFFSVLKLSRHRTSHARYKKGKQTSCAQKVNREEREKRIREKRREIVTVSFLSDEFSFFTARLRCCLFPRTWQ